MVCFFFFSLFLFDEDPRDGKSVPRDGKSSSFAAGASIVPVVSHEP
jgi:hypothetical protein